MGDLRLEGGDRYKKLVAMPAADRYLKKDPRTLELPVHIVKSGHETAQASNNIVDDCLAPLFLHKQWLC
jgi:hypothetical protein